VVTGYILSNVLIMPITGLLSARFGRRNFYFANIALFTVSSMLCGLARTLPLLVAFRVLQGIGGGVLITVSQAILRESFSASEQGMAMGLYGMGTVLAPAFGPTLGGWLTDLYSWPWVFYINVPIGALNLLLVSRYIHDPPYFRRERGPIDFPGLALMMMGLGALQLMLEKGESRNWFESGFITALTVLSALALMAFVWRELRVARPAVDLRILGNVSFASATAIGGVLGMALYGSLFLLPLFLQNLLGYPAMRSGLALMPRSLAMAVCMPIVGRLYNRTGPRALVMAGLVVSAYSFWQLSHITLEIGIRDILWPQVWQGLGFSMLFVALSTAALATIAPERMTTASGLYNVVRQVFGSVGIAVSATLLTSGMARNRAVLAQHVTAFDAATRAFVQSVTGAMTRTGVDANTATARALALLEGRLTRQAMVLSYEHVFRLVALLFLVALPLALLLRTPRPGAGAEVAVD